MSLAEPHEPAWLKLYVQQERAINAALVAIDDARKYVGNYNLYVNEYNALQRLWQAWASPSTRAASIAILESYLDEETLNLLKRSPTEEFGLP